MAYLNKRGKNWAAGRIWTLADEENPLLIWRRENGIGRKALARRIGVTGRSIDQWEWSGIPEHRYDSLQQATGVDFRPLIRQWKNTSPQARATERFRQARAASVAYDKVTDKIRHLVWAITVAGRLSYDRDYKHRQAVRRLTQQLHKAAYLITYSGPHRLARNISRFAIAHERYYNRAVKKLGRAIRDAVTGHIHEQRRAEREQRLRLEIKRVTLLEAKRIRAHSTAMGKQLARRAATERIAYLEEALAYLDRRTHFEQEQAERAKKRLRIAERSLDRAKGKDVIAPVGKRLNPLAPQYHMVTSATKEERALANQFVADHPDLFQPDRDLGMRELDTTTGRLPTRNGESAPLKVSPIFGETVPTKRRYVELQRECQCTDPHWRQFGRTNFFFCGTCGKALGGAMIFKKARAS